jgi:hypothetical protein
MKKTGRKFLFLFEERVVVEVTTEEQLHTVSLALLAKRSPAWPKYDLHKSGPMKDRMTLYETARKAIAKKKGAVAYDLLCQVSRQTGHEFDSMYIINEVNLTMPKEQA